METLMLRRRLMVVADKEIWPVSMIVQMIPNTIINISNGETQRNTSWAASDYIAIPKGTSNAGISSTEYGYGSFTRGAFYDLQKSCLSTFGPVNVSRPLTPPTGAEYIRYSVQTGSNSQGITRIDFNDQ